MEITLDLIVFTVLAVFTLASAVLAVTTKRILRAATFLLFVLFGTAGIYFQLNYSFLGAVPLLIVTLRHQFLPEHFEHGELAVREIGFALMSPEKQGYLLPFEVISLLLLACIVGGILIARKR